MESVIHQPVAAHINYQRISEAIDYIQTHFKDQPDLDEVAAAIHMSPFHFQRIFTEWAGTSPKKFLQYISLEHAKKLLREAQTSIAEAAYETGLSGTSRLHDLFIQIEGMTPATYKNGGQHLRIDYQFTTTLFGPVLIASTPKGICHISFADNKAWALTVLREDFPQALLREKATLLQQNALAFFNGNWQQTEQVKLHLKGSDFQLKVWETLLKIPAGRLSTYGTIARQLNKPGASRAVGTAIGSNPVAFLIPCHRVIQSSGILGGYRWGAIRKTAMIGWEQAQ